MLGEGWGRVVLGRGGCISVDWLQDSRCMGGAGLGVLNDLEFTGEGPHGW